MMMMSATMLSFTTKRRTSFFVFVFLFSMMMMTSSWTTSGRSSCAMLLFANAERGRKRNSGEYDERSEKTTFRIFVCVLQKASNSSFVSSKTGQV